MSNVLGNNLIVNIYGESHSEKIGVTVLGLPKGIKVDDEVIKCALAKRRPILGVDTSRVETDPYVFLSGVKDGVTTGEPLTLEITNKNTKSSDYDNLKDIPRPGHADYVGYMKYGDEYDFHGGGFFSGRLTAPLVAISSIVIKALEEKGIYIGTHILKCGEVCDSKISSFDDIKKINSKTYSLINDLEDKLNDEINKVKVEQDSIGGITETVVYGLPVGLGDKSFESVEGVISKAIFGVGAIKGIEFGEGFNFANLKGSEANDEFAYENDKVVTLTNHNGGINGGITNGMPISFNCVVKPTPSISKPQRSVNLKTKENVKIEIKGRHDPAIIRRIPIVITSVTALAVLDLLISEYGPDYFVE
ncbi:MAG: chorismate synthase [Bacilli bacterium]|nr:chorismate synthase [Bacilli bacterium]